MRTLRDFAVFWRQPANAKYILLVALAAYLTMLCHWDVRHDAASRQFVFTNYLRPKEWRSLARNQAGAVVGALVLWSLAGWMASRRRGRPLADGLAGTSFCFAPGLLPILGVGANVLGWDKDLAATIEALSLAAIAAWLWAEMDLWPLRAAESEKHQPRFYARILAAAVAAYAALFGWLSVARYQTFFAALQDLGMYTQQLWGNLHGHWFLCSHYGLRGDTMLAEHFMPLVLLLTPFYAIWQDPRTILVVQALGVALAAVPLYGIALRLGIDRRAALFLSASYLLHPLLQVANLYDFHPDAFVPLFALGSFWALLGLDEHLRASETGQNGCFSRNGRRLPSPMLGRGWGEGWIRRPVTPPLTLPARGEGDFRHPLSGDSKYRFPKSGEAPGQNAPHPFPWRLALGYGLFLLLWLSCKEDSMFGVVMLGFYALVFRRRWRLGLATMTIALIWGALALRWIIPHFRGAPYSHVDRYYHLVMPFGWTEGEGSFFVEFLKVAALHPFYLLGQIFTPPRILALLKLLGPVAFLSLLGPKELLIAAPAILLNLFSDGYEQYEFRLHYPFAMLPFVYASALVGLRNFSAWMESYVVRYDSSAPYLTPLSWLTTNLRKGSKAAEEGAAARRRLQSQMAPALLAFLMAAALCRWFGETPLSRSFAAEKVWRKPHHRLAEKFLAAIPPDASLSAQTGLAAHATHRREIFQFPDLERKPDYMLLDAQAPTWPLSPTAYAERVSTLLTGSTYGIVMFEDGYLLLRRGHSTDLNPAAHEMLKRYH